MMMKSSKFEEARVSQCTHILTRKFLLVMHYPRSLWLQIAQARGTIFAGMYRISHPCARLHKALLPRRSFAAILHRIQEFIPTMDHAEASKHPDVDAAGKTPALALEWLFDAQMESFRDGDDKSILYHVRFSVHLC